MLECACSSFQCEGYLRVSFPATTLVILGTGGVLLVNVVLDNIGAMVRVCGGGEGGGKGGDAPCSGCAGFEGGREESEVADCNDYY